MQHLEVFLKLSAILAAVLFSTTAGKEAGRIVNGQEYTIDQVPYQALVVLPKEICGGSIIAEKCILTAAHCFAPDPETKEDITPDQVHVRVGSMKYEEGGQYLSVLNINRHPNYNNVTYDYDAVVLELESPITFNDNVKCVELATEEAATGTTMTISGWGQTGENEATTNQLRGTTVNIVDRDTCKQQLKPYEVTDNMICAYGNGRDTCQGDSGGPLANGNTQYGIVSWGQGCGAKDKSGVYTNVPKIFPWIKTYLNNDD